MTWQPAGNVPPHGSVMPLCRFSSRLSGKAGRSSSLQVESEEPPTHQGGLDGGSRGGLELWDKSLICLWHTFYDLLRSVREKRSHNQRERAKMGGGVPDVRLLTTAEEEATEITGEEGGKTSRDGACTQVAEHLVPQESFSGEEEEANGPEGASSPASCSTSATADRSTRFAEDLRLESGSQAGVHDTDTSQQLREHVLAGSPDKRRTAVDQTPAQPHAHDDPLFVATRSLLNVQQSHMQNMSEMPEVMCGFSCSMEESMQAMMSAMSRAFEWNGFLSRESGELRVESG
ncbi:uncharacterized protein [Heterodontus francisci]|uniref:uncharacterized protein n=1 Tax=Heterodontus francisci TaxID=7792 RepID=UPI00355B9D32